MLLWIQERICCSIPDAKSCPELHRLVTRYQLHRCTEYCKRKCKVKGQTDVFITRCRFSFPRQPCDVAQLNPVEECLKSRNKIYQLCRTAVEAVVNDYNPTLLLAWKANMDIQFVAESSLALANYVTAYVTKPEKSNLQEVWQSISDDKNAFSRLYSFGSRCLRSKECGLYEAADMLLAHALLKKSCEVKYIDTSLPAKRKRRVKT